MAKPPKKHAQKNAPAPKRSWWRWPEVARTPLGWKVRALDMLTMAAVICVVAVIGKDRADPMHPGQMQQGGYWNAEPLWADDIQQVKVMESKFVARVIQEGKFPWWDHWSGMPFDTTFSHNFPLSVWYPGLLSIPWGAAIGVKISLVLLLMFAAWGAYAFMWRLTGSRFVAWLAGMVFVFNRFSLFEHVGAGHYDMTFSYALFPWWMVCLDHALTVTRETTAPKWDWRWAVIAGVFGGWVVLVDIQFGVMNWVMAGFFMVARYVGVDGGPARREVLKASGVVVGCTVLGAGYFIGSFLSYQPYLNFQKYGQDWMESLSTNVDLLMKHWAPIWGIPGRGGWTSYFSDHASVTWISAWPWLAVGILLVALRDGRLWYFLAIYLFSMGMAMGKHGPFFVFYEYLPLFNRFRTPIRFYNIAGFAMCYVVPMAFGVVRDRWMKTLPSPQKTWGAVIVFFVLILGVLDGPKAWEVFKSGVMYPGHEDLYEYIRSHPQPASVTQHPFNFVENRMTRWGIYLHEHRDPMGMAHVVDTRYSARAYKTSNLELGSEGLSKFLSVANIGYVIPRNAATAENLAHMPDVSLAMTGKDGQLFRHARPMPLVRGVGSVVGFVGDQADISAQLLLNEPSYLPEKTAALAADTPEQETAVRAFVSPDDIMTMDTAPRWRKVRSAGPSTSFVRIQDGARMTVAGPPRSWNGWRMGRLQIDTKDTPQVSVMVRGSIGASLAMQLFFEDGGEMPTGFVGIPLEWQRLTLPMQGDKSIVGMELQLLTTDGREAWMEIKDITAGGPKQSRVVEDFRGVGRPSSPIAWPKNMETAKVTILEDQSRPGWGTYRFTCDVKGGAGAPSTHRSGGPVSPRGRPGVKGLAVVTERWFPTWRAWVDGKEVSILRAYGAFIGVPLVGEGRHVVEVKYAGAPLQRVGWMLTFGGGWVALACGVWIAISNRRKSPDVQPVVTPDTPLAG